MFKLSSEHMFNLKEMYLLTQFSILAKAKQKSTNILNVQYFVKLPNILDNSSCVQYEKIFGALHEQIEAIQIFSKVEL